MELRRRRRRAGLVSEVSETEQRKSGELEERSLARSEDKTKLVPGSGRSKDIEAACRRLKTELISFEEIRSAVVGGVTHQGGDCEKVVCDPARQH